jgi:hypothetical protein
MDGFGWANGFRLFLPPLMTLKQRTKIQNKIIGVGVSNIILNLISQKMEISWKYDSSTSQPSSSCQLLNSTYSIILGWGYGLDN